MKTKSYRVKRTFPHSEPMFRGKVLDNPNFRNLGALIRNGYLEEISNSPELNEIELAGETNEIPSDEILTNLSEIGDSTVEELSQPGEISELPPSELSGTSVTKTAPEIISASDPAADQTPENTEGGNLTGGSEVTEIVGGTTAETIEEIQTTQAQTEPIKTQNGDAAPELRKGDTVESLCKRYNKEKLLRLAKDLKVTVNADHNKDEIAEKILKSKAAKKFVE